MSVIKHFFDMMQCTVLFQGLDYDYLLIFCTLFPDFFYSSLITCIGLCATTQFIELFDFRFSKQF